MNDYARMYGNDEEETTQTITDQPEKYSGILSMPVLTNMVRQLQIELKKQQDLVEKQGREIKRLRTIQGQMLNSARSMSRDMNDFSSALDNKINHRDD